MKFYMISFSTVSCSWRSRARSSDIATKRNAMLFVVNRSILRAVKSVEVRQVGQDAHFGFEKLFKLK